MSQQAEQNEKTDPSSDGSVLFCSASSSNLELFVRVLRSLYELQPHLSVLAIKPSKRLLRRTTITWNRLEGSALFTRFVGNGAGDLFGFALWNRDPYLWITRDDGITWEAHARIDLLRSIRAIVLDGRRAGYAATENGIVVTRDNGLTWSMVYRSPAYAVTVDKRGSAIVMTDSGVVRSDDHGRSWQVIADTTLLFTELATAHDGSIIGYRAVQGIDTSFDGSLFSHTVSHEIWRSVDRGATWKLFSEGLPDDPILSFAADRSTGAVYVATEGGGLFRMVGRER